MLVKTALVLLTTALLFTMEQASLSHDDSSDEQGCTLLDKTHAPHFITYERKFESNIQLRLRNNTSCPIVIETDDQYPTRLRRLPQGGAKIESVLRPEDGLRLRVHYLVQDRRRGESLKRAYGWGDSVFVYEIPPGQSILFDVPASHFRRRLDIAVPFRYGWEGHKPIATGVGGVAHRVYFLRGKQ
jgi:hypothetical protein